MLRRLSAMHASIGYPVVNAEVAVNQGLRAVLVELDNARATADQRSAKRAHGRRQLEARVVDA